jgi:hypothetical protein
MRRRAHRHRFRLEIRSAAERGDLPALIRWVRDPIGLSFGGFNDPDPVECDRDRVAVAELAADELRAVGLEAALAAALSEDRAVGAHKLVPVVVRTFAADTVNENAELLASVMSRTAPTDAEGMLSGLEQCFTGFYFDNALAEAIERLKERVGEDAPMVVAMRKRLASNRLFRRKELEYEAKRDQEAREAREAREHDWERRLYAEQHKHTIGGNIKVLETSTVYGEGRKEFYEAVRQLGEAGSRAVLPLIRLLETGSAQGRAGAAEALGKIGDPRAIPALEAHVDDSAEYDESCYQSMGEYRHVRDEVLAALTSIKRAQDVKPPRKPAAKSRTRRPATRKPPQAPVAAGQ